VALGKRPAERSLPPLNPSGFVSKAIDSEWPRRGMFCVQRDKCGLLLPHREPSLGGAFNVDWKAACCSLVKSLSLSLLQSLRLVSQPARGEFALSSRQHCFSPAKTWLALSRVKLGWSCHRASHSSPIDSLACLGRNGDDNRE